jgi:hypothetical protein
VSVAFRRVGVPDKGMLGRPDEKHNGHPSCSQTLVRSLQFVEDVVRKFCLGRSGG